MKTGYNVAIDGPAGAGKSTVAKRVAREKGYVPGYGAVSDPKRDRTR